MKGTSLDDKKYHASYVFKREEPPVSRDELRARRSSDGQPWMPVDAMLFASIIQMKERGVDSVIFGSHNGITGKPLDDTQMFDVLGLLAESLAVSETLDPKRREFCQLVARTWRKSKE